jgi:hypothetical protein
MLGVILDLIITSATGCDLSKEFPNLFFVNQKRGGDITTISVKHDGSSGVWVIDYHYPGTAQWPKGTVIFFPVN